MQFDQQNISKVFSHGDDEKSEEYVKYLLNQGDSIIPIVSNLLDSKDPEVRWWAIRTLSEFKNPPTEKFIEMLADVSSEVRQCAILALCYHPNQDAKKELLLILAKEGQFIANLAATALISIGKDAVLEILELIPELEGHNKGESYRALANIEDSRSIPLLMEGLTDDSLLVNYWAEEGLTRLGLDMVYIKPK